MTAHIIRTKYSSAVFQKYLANKVVFVCFFPPILNTDGSILLIAQIKLISRLKNDFSKGTGMGVMMFFVLRACENLKVSFSASWNTVFGFLSEICLVTRKKWQSLLKVRP